MAEKKLNVELKGVKAKLQTARVALQKKNLKKSGKNDFAHFEYFELKDFMPEVNEIFASLGLYSEFSIVPTTIDVEETNIDGVITKKPIIREMAILVIEDVQEENSAVQYEMEVAPVMVGNNSKQNIYQAAGGRNSYYKRYLYMNALEIVEDDELDATLGQPQNNQPTSYDFMPKQVAQPVQQIAPQPQVQPVITEKQVEEVEQVINDTVALDQPLSMDSKMEIMNLVNEKGLNGAELLNDFCAKNNLTGPNDLLEVHKQTLLDIINGG